MCLKESFPNLDEMENRIFFRNLKSKSSNIESLREEGKKTKLAISIFERKQVQEVMAIVSSLIKYYWLRTESTTYFKLYQPENYKIHS
ncbi:hypothetical protein KFK09_002490 [Dendrobium nobile]|uniref:Uncharacterized protein n=1 Tax=Dendrobium nobile TaxID=94219 RepID=A0A8T3C1G5_DENNO|nr:hypothetical protein KFK09_002490 [Dendrobium nobile]